MNSMRGQSASDLASSAVAPALSLLMGATGAATAEEPTTFLALLLVSHALLTLSLKKFVCLDDFESAYWDAWRWGCGVLVIGYLGFLCAPDGYFALFVLPILLVAAPYRGTGANALLRGMIVSSAAVGSLLTGQASEVAGVQALLCTGFVALLATQQIKTDATRLALAQELQEERSRAEARSRMLGSLSHEFRTPLESILGSLELLRESALSRHQRELTDTVEGSGLVLRRLVADALEYTRLEAGKLEIDPVRTNTRRLLQLCIDAARANLRRETTLHLTLPSNLPRYVSVDRERLQQVIGNLLSNATTFTSHGSIEVRVSYDEPKLSVTVEDSGCGIATTEQPKIFDAFHQGTLASGVGTGLGLAICRRLVHLMGGWISVESVPNEGSAFTFFIQAPELPALSGENETTQCSAAELLRAPSQRPRPWPAPATEYAEEEQSGLIISPSHQESSRPLVPPLHECPRVLLADDNPINLRVAEMMLEELGCEVHTASDGLEALHLAARYAFDVIFLDCEMPIVNGWEAAARIHQTNPELPIVALTANALPQNRDRCADAGMHTFLAKPVRLDELRSVFGRANSSEAWTF